MFIVGHQQDGTSRDFGVVFQESIQLQGGNRLETILVQAFHQQAKIVFRNLVGIGKGSIGDYHGT